MNRRHLLTGLVAAPFVIRTAGLLMPVRRVELRRRLYVAPRSIGRGDGTAPEHAMDLGFAIAGARDGDYLIAAQGIYSGRPLLTA